MNTKSRLVSLDILRGFTVAGMILVNNGWGESFEMLRHSRWNGLTPCDLVFPFFLFIMGISCYLSLVKSGFQPTRQVLQRIARRTVLLFAIGLFINWFDHAVEGDLLCFGHLRVWAVMQRIALCYGVVSLFAVGCPHRLTLPVAAGLLAVYTVILLAGNGYAYDADVNILAQADLRLFGYDHIYHKSPVDPEGLLGTIPSVAHVLLGFYCGSLVRRGGTVGDKALAVFVFGTVLLFLGWLLSFGLPLNKRIWSPSYALVTCGLASLLLGALVSTERGGAGDSPLKSFFLVFGVNALALYVSSELLAIVLKQVGLSELVYDGIHAVVAPLKWASLGYALYFVLLNYAIGYILYRQKIFIKL